MTQPTQGKEITIDTVQEELEKQFPKGQCKERGHALVLFAYFKMCLDQALADQRDEDARIAEKSIREYQKDGQYHGDVLTCRKIAAAIRKGKV